jgi:glycosyltransferase involved in cell wall biosynthesis
MRIAYIAPYQGPDLLLKRPIVRNLGLAANLKMEVIAGLLQKSGHQVEILSQGEVVERRAKFYPAFSEANRFNPSIAVHYASTFPGKFINGLWSTWETLRLFKQRHRAQPYDLVFIYNLKLPQVMCAKYAVKRLRLPVVLEYEDDTFVDVGGRPEAGVQARLYERMTRELLGALSGCVAVSPHLLAQVPGSIPKLLLRGVVGEDCVAPEEPTQERQNRVVFSGTHFRSKGIEQLIQGWKIAGLADWELHITGKGELTEKLRGMAADSPRIVFHGMVSRAELVRLLRSARICINPHGVSQTPGNVFAFKIVEYLAAGAHVVTTRMGELEKDIEQGITYMGDNAPETIAATLADVIKTRRWERTASQCVCNKLGPTAVSKSLNSLLHQVASN